MELQKLTGQELQYDQSHRKVFKLGSIKQAVGSTLACRIADTAMLTKLITDHPLLISRTRRLPYRIKFINRWMSDSGGQIEIRRIIWAF